jgi:hypothetical protein
MPSLGRAATLPASPTTDGLSCTLLNPTTPAQVAPILQKAGFDPASPEAKRFAAYADAHHSFLLVTVTSIHDYAAATPNDPIAIHRTDTSFPCIVARFPAPSPVMPARMSLPNSTYIPDNICLLGTLKPNTLPPKAKLSHFRGQLHLSTTPAPRDIPYTRLINTQPTQELWFDPDPSTAQLESSIDLLHNPVVFITLLILWTAACSYLAAGTAGFLIAKQWRPYATLGLWNLATLIALAIAVKRQQRLPKLHRLLHRRIFILSFSLLFLTLNGAASWLLRLLLGLYWPTTALRAWPWYGIGG